MAYLNCLIMGYYINDSGIKSSVFNYLEIHSYVCMQKYHIYYIKIYLTLIQTMDLIIYVENEGLGYGNFIFVIHYNFFPHTCKYMLY